MHPKTEDLLTRWLTGEGAKDIMVAAGLIPNEIYIPEFCVSRLDRQEYLYSLLFTVACSVGKRSANPAAFVEGSEEDAYWSYAAWRIKEWAETSAAELERLLEAL
jgi:hypothetical protein